MFDDTKRSIHIVGQGAIGSLLFARLTQANRAVTTHIRPNSVPVESVTLFDGQTINVPVPLKSMPNLSNNSIVILPLKAYQLLSALRDIAPRLNASHDVVLLHNGMIETSLIDNVVPGICWFRAITSHAAIKNEQQVVQTGHGSSQIGFMSAQNSLCDQAAVRLPKLLNHLSTCLGPLSTEKNMLEATWIKLIINSVINPLTALHGIKNGYLDNSQYATKINNLVSEACDVAIKNGVQLSEQKVQSKVYEVIHNTAENYSSMYQDLQYKRPSELEYISGFIVRTGKLAGISVSEHEALYQDLKNMYAIY